jgi:hypothetical protein
MAEKMGETKFFILQETDQDRLYNLKELEKKSHIINEAFDILKTPRLDNNGREIKSF